MKIKTLIAASLFFSRHQEGSDSQVNFFEFARKFEAKQDGDFALEMSMSTGFLLKLNQANDFIGTKLPIVQQVFEEIYLASKQVTPGKMFSANGQGLLRDIQVKQQRELILTAFNDSKSSKELRELCLRVLLNTGLA